MPAQDRLGDVVGVPVQCLSERLIGRAGVPVAAPVEHDRALFEGRPGDLGGRAGLANPGLTAQQDSPAPPGRGLPTASSRRRSSS